MSKPQRKDYIRAVQCLLDAPARLTQYGWANKNRYDDFVAVHINMTLAIHGTANFLTWHRYFVHLWERALRDECGYRGYQPVSRAAPIPSSSLCRSTSPAKCVAMEKGTLC